MVVQCSTTLSEPSLNVHGSRSVFCGSPRDTRDLRPKGPVEAPRVETVRNPVGTFDSDGGRDIYPGTTAEGCRTVRVPRPDLRVGGSGRSTPVDCDVPTQDAGSPGPWGTSGPSVGDHGRGGRDRTWTRVPERPTGRGRRCTSGPGWGLRSPGPSTMEASGGLGTPDPFAVTPPRVGCDSEPKEQTCYLSQETGSHTRLGIEVGSDNPETSHPLGCPCDP